MKKHFYSHLVNIDSLVSDLDTLDLTEKQKKELLEIAHLHMHQTIIDEVLSQLSEEDKKVFLELLASGEDKKIWKHLNEKVEKIEDKISLAAKQVEKELKADVDDLST